MTERITLCGNREILIVDLHEGAHLLPMPSISNDLEKNRDPNHKCAGQVLVSGISPSGKYCVVADDSKHVFVFDLSNVTSPDLVADFSVPRRPSCYAFSTSEDAVLIADKSGDVFRATLESPQKEEASLILGHVSIITDMQMSPSGRLLVTADRDEKIRLSRYPNCYNIESFLLSHRGFVSRISFSQCGRFLCSAGSDGLLLLWSVEEACCLAEANFRTLVNSADALVNGLHWIDDKLLLTFEGLSKTAVFRVDTNDPSLTPAQDFECGAAVRGSFAVGKSVLLLTEHEKERLVLLQSNDGLFQRCDDHEVLAKINSDFAEQLRAAAALSPVLTTLQKCPVDKTGLEAYNERKHEIQKNVLARRTRHQQLKAKRQRKDESPEVPVA